MTYSCLHFFLLQRKSLRDQWLMEGAPPSPASSVTQSPRSPLWGSEAQKEEHIDQYSCGWVFFLPIMVPTLGQFITILRACVGACAWGLSVCLRLQLESQQLTEEEKEPMENRKTVRNLHRFIHTHSSSCSTDRKGAAKCVEHTCFIIQLVRLGFFH